MYKRSIWVYRNTLSLWIYSVYQSVVVYLMTYIGTTKREPKFQVFNYEFYFTRWKFVLLACVCWLLSPWSCVIEIKNALRTIDCAIYLTSMVDCSRLFLTHNLNLVTMTLSLCHISDNTQQIYRKKTHTQTHTRWIEWNRFIVVVACFFLRVFRR